MNPAAKILLFLLAAPFLLAVFLLIVPLLIVLLIFSLFVPSIRIFHLSRFPYGNAERKAAGREEPPFGEDAVYDVECTVVETSEESEEHDAAGQQPKLKT